MAFELVLTLSESASAMMRKQPNFVTTIVPLAMNWLATIEDDEEWDNADDTDDDDNETNAIVAEQGLDRIARYIGGKSVLPMAFQLIPTFLGSPEWQKRHAALMTISAIGEGCHKIMQAELDNILKLVVQFVRDPHPRVRYAACHAMGQMSTDFAVSFFAVARALTFRSQLTFFHFLSKHNSPRSSRNSTRLLFPL